MEENFDLAIIGGGPAGYNAAERAAQNGLKAVLFESRKLGGVCLNEGCIPTKTLLHTAKLLDNAKDGSKYGINADNISYDYATIYKRKNKVVDALVNGVANRLRKHKVTVVNARAHIEKREPNGIVITAAGESYTCNNLMIATGASAIIPPIPGLKREGVLTSTEILDMQKVPASLIVIGGGYIGLEFGSFYRSLGTEVTVIEMQNEICPGMDKEISGMLRKELTRKGLKIYLNSRVVEFQGKKVIFEKEGQKHDVEAEEILISVGRKPNITGFGLENLDVLTKNGNIVVDHQLKTNIPGVFAAGDVTGHSLLAHTAYREGEVVVNNLSGRRDTMRYDAIPGVIYTNPEVASIGLTEEEAKKRNIEYVVKKLPMAYSGRFLAENEGKTGYSKIIIGKKYKEILGVHMIGGSCSEMIYGAAMMIEGEYRITDMEEIVFPHPTVSEVLRENIFAFKD